MRVPREVIPLRDAEKPREVIPLRVAGRPREVILLRGAARPVEVMALRSAGKPGEAIVFVPVVSLPTMLGAVLPEIQARNSDVASRNAGALARYFQWAASAGRTGQRRRAAALPGQNAEPPCRQRRR